MTNFSGAGYRTERSEHLSSCCDAPPKSKFDVKPGPNINRIGHRNPTPISDDGIGICSACGEWTEFNEVEVDDD